MALDTVNCIETNTGMVGKVLLCFSRERQENSAPTGKGKDLRDEDLRVVSFIFLG